LSQYDKFNKVEVPRPHLIKVAEPDLSGKESQYVQQCIASGWVSGGGVFVEEFEDRIARATGREWAYATVTGTAALHLALKAVGVCPGRKVKLRSYTFIATANAISYLGGEPIFTDIEEGDTIDACPLVPDQGLAICDSAAAIGNKTATERGWLAALSFNGNKTITTGQGGAVIGDDPVLLRKVRHFAEVAKCGNYEHDSVGFNYQMSNLNAAVGCAQIERLDEFVESKRRISNRYKEAFGKVEFDSTWMSFLDCDNRSGLIWHLQNEGIEAKPFWMPVHLQKPYMGFKCQRMENTSRIWRRRVCLPCSTKLTVDQQDKVLRACEKFLSLPPDAQTEHLLVQS
jgi:dTDP-4-amino-4,6-dideoxygalactose transaminase